MIGLLNSKGDLVAQYIYDAWGRPISIQDGDCKDVSGDPSHIANRNPLRYRGYYYDQETGFYYLQSRYYAPVLCRFINADSFASAGQAFVGYNMFAYCNNSPVSCTDSAGGFPTYCTVQDVFSDPFGIRSAMSGIGNYSTSPKSNTVGGIFQDVAVGGSASLTSGYYEFNWRLQDNLKSSGSLDGWLGGFAKISGGNANGKIGIGNDKMSASLKGVCDTLTATAQAGFHYKNGFELGAKAKAAALTGRATTEFEIFG